VAALGLCVRVVHQGAHEVEISARTEGVAGAAHHDGAHVVVAGEGGPDVGHLLVLLGIDGVARSPRVEGQAKHARSRSIELEDRKVHR
jgi:hypothetical protein